MQNNPKSIRSNSIQTSYRWEHISKEKLLNTLGNVEIIDEIVQYETTHFEKNNCGVEKAEQNLRNIFVNLAQHSCRIVKPFRKQKSCKNKPWADRELADLKKTVFKLGSALKKQPYDLHIKNSFLKYSKDCKKLTKKKIHLYKKQLFDKLLELRNSDPKQYWKMLKSLKHEDSGKNIELQANFTDLMNHFKSQGETPYFDKEFKDKIEFEVSGDINLSVNEVTDKPFSASEIGKCIRRLKTGKSTGPDLISNEIIKFSSAVTCKAIKKPFNLILDSGKYPSSWRKSFIILIHKSGDKLNMNNYIGISLQNCIAKLFSAALNSRLIEFYEDKFAIEQFGFRVNHRTTDSIFILKSLITKYLTKKKSKIYACFVDLRRAFDTVWHEGLLYKLKESKIGKKMFDIIKDMYSCCQSAV